MTKTFPQWVAKRKNHLLKLLHIRQKSVKVDDTKINDEKKEEVKEDLAKANKANITLEAQKQQFKDRHEGNMNAMANVIKDIYSNIKKNSEETKNSIEKNQKDLDDINNELDKLLDSEEKAKKTIKDVSDKLSDLADKSESEEEKAELNKAADAIEQGKVVEMASEKLDYLEGYLMDIKKVEECYSFCASFGTAMYRTIMGPQLRILVNIQDSNGDYFETGDPNTDTKVKNGALEELNEYGSKYKSYFDAKKEKDIDISKILQKKNKIKLTKQNVEKELNSRKNSLDITDMVANNMKKSVEELVSALEKFKSQKEVNQQLLAKCISIGNQFMKDMTSVLEDCTKINVAIINGYENFLTTAKPC